MKVKRQHYVPRMYLKRFAIDQKRTCVWNLEKDELLTRQRVENYAVKRYFYDTEQKELEKAMCDYIEVYPDIAKDINFADEQFVEKVLSRIENDANKVLNLICADNEELFNEENSIKLVCFLHDLTYRSEKYRNQLNDVHTQFINFYKKLNIPLENVEWVDESAKNHQLYQLLGIGPLIETAAKLRLNYNWYIGINDNNMKFVISDNPAQGIWLGFNDICFPLCGEKAIIFRVKKEESPMVSADEPNGSEIRLSERSVFTYNAIQASYANRFMFGDKKSLEFLKRACDRQGGHRKIFDQKFVLRY